MDTTITITDEAIPFLNIDNEHATCRISMYGGHVVSFIPKADNRERLYLSPNAVLDGSKPIRGGIPLCWPWFSDAHGQPKGELPSHGYLRTQMWSLDASEQTDVGTKLILKPSFSNDEGFKHDVCVELHLVVGDFLSVSLITTNTGVSSFVFDCALHTYFAVDNINNVELSGITGKYKDKLNNWALTDTPSPYKFNGETDRIHLNNPDAVSITCEQIVIPVLSSGHDSLVVWNPGEQAAKMADMPEDGYQFMVCVETAITRGVTLEPGETRTLNQTIK